MFVADATFRASLSRQEILAGERRSYAVDGVVVSTRTPQGLRESISRDLKLFYKLIKGFINISSKSTF